MPIDIGVPQSVGQVLNDDGGRNGDVQAFGKTDHRDF